MMPMPLCLPVKASIFRFGDKVNMVISKIPPEHQILLAKKGLQFRVIRKNSLLYPSALLIQIDDL
jgi:hypothetical protein